MAKKLPQRISGEKRCHRRGAKFNLLSGRCDTTAEFIVVCEAVQQRLESANRDEIVATKYQRRTQAKMQSSFEEPRAQHAGNEVCAEAQSLWAGAQCCSRQATIETRDESDR